MKFHMIPWEKNLIYLTKSVHGWLALYQENILLRICWYIVTYMKIVHNFIAIFRTLAYHDWECLYETFHKSWEAIKVSADWKVFMQHRCNCDIMVLEEKMCRFEKKFFAALNKIYYRPQRITICCTVEECINNFSTDH